MVENELFFLDFSVSCFPILVPSTFPVDNLCSPLPYSRLHHICRSISVHILGLPKRYAPEKIPVENTMMAMPTSKLGVTVDKPVSVWLEVSRMLSASLRFDIVRFSHKFLRFCCHFLT